MVKKNSHLRTLLMGNEESLNNQQSLSVSPVIKKLRNTLHLNIISNKTSSFVNENFTSQIKKTSGLITRSNNPFCPIGSSNPKDNQQYWLNCCLISPIMAIASPRLICDQKGNYSKNVKILGVTKKHGYIQVFIKDVIIIKQSSICLLILEKPIIDLGWAGITCLNSQDQIHNEPYKIINHSKSQLDTQNDVLTYHQQIKKAFYKVEKDFVGRFESMPASLVFKIIDKKPYIVGIQINQRQAQFITKEILNKINQIATKSITIKRQKQILQTIDIQQLQLMEKL